MPLAWEDPTDYWNISPQVAGTLPLGLRKSNNLFNIKYYPGAERNQTQWPGLMGPSSARDQGDRQMLFANVEDSGVAGANLLQRKYASGMLTPRQLIAGRAGWTPGREDSAANVARIAGLGLDEDARLNTPEGLRRFLPALAEQEHGNWVARNLFNPGLFDRIAARVRGAPSAPLAPAPRLSDTPEQGPTFPPEIMNANRMALGGGALPALGHFDFGTGPGNYPTSPMPDFPTDVTPGPIMPTPPRPPPDLGAIEPFSGEAPGPQAPPDFPTEPAGPMLSPPQALHDPTAFPQAPPTPFQMYGLQPMEPQQGFPTQQRPSLEGSAALQMPVPPASDAGTVVPSDASTAVAGATPRSIKTTTVPGTANQAIAAGAAQQEPPDESIAAKLGAPGFARWARAFMRGPGMAGIGGLGYGAQGFAAGLGYASQSDQNDIARARLGLEAQQRGEQHEKYGRDLAAYQGKVNAFNKLFPGGEPDPNAAALKDLTEPARRMLAAAGPEAAIDWLGKYQLNDAEGRAKMIRDAEQIQIFKQMAAGQSPTQAAGGEPTAPATPPQLPSGPPMPPDVAGLGRPSIGAPGTQLPPQVGVAASRAYAPLPGAGGVSPPAPAAAPPSPAQAASAMPQLPPMGGRAFAPGTGPTAPYPGLTGGPQGGGVPEPLVPVMGTMMPLSQAQYFAQYLAAIGKKNEQLEKDIATAQAPGQQYLTTRAQELAQRQAGIEKARQGTSGLLDANDRAWSLATKIRNDPNLWWVTGMMGSDRFPHLNYGGVASVKSDINDLIGQIGNSVLQALRAQSATGASGFGQTNEVEIKMVKDALAGLQDRTLPYEKYQENLDIVLNAFNRVRARTLGTWQETYNAPFREPGGGQYKNPAQGDETGYPTQSVAEKSARALAEEKAANKAASEGKPPPAGMKKPTREPDEVKVGSDGVTYHRFGKSWWAE